VRSGIDDPIGMPVEIAAVRNGVYSWRYPLLFLACAIVFAAWTGPSSPFPYLFIVFAAIPLVWVASTIRSRRLGRSVLRSAASHGDQTVDLRTARILTGGDWIRLGVVIAECVVLVWLLRGGKA
jgi:hypothetical protein